MTGNFGLILGIFNIAVSTTLSDEIKDPDADPFKNFPKVNPDPQELNIDYWQNQAFQLLGNKLRKLNINKAKNIIFFMGSGMSSATITASRIYKGQLEKKPGEEGQLFFEKFPFIGLSKTYCVDRQVPDSGCTSTAYMSGVKTNFKTVGVTAKVKLSDCEEAKLETNRVSSILKWAQEAGKATGIVTNTRVTHASSAAAYAHVSYREFECDDDIVTYKMHLTCNDDIARQLVEESPGKFIKVILGGGRNKFLPKQNPDSTHGTGSRNNKDLIEVWKQDKVTKNSNGVYVTDVDSFNKVDPEKTDYLLGLFAQEHMSYHLDDPKSEPPLWKMTEKAIQILQNEKNGFFLFVAGGKIDQAHHSNQAKLALDETLEFDKAIETAAKMTDEQNTLIVVIADHSHTMTINGYPYRGHKITGIFGKSNKAVPYATLSYANGPGYQKEIMSGIQRSLELDNMDDIHYKFPAMVPKDKASHGGEDVPVYARGPWAHLFAGNYEQNYIPIAEAYAAQIGPATQVVPQQEPKPNDNSAKIILPNFLSFLSGIVLIAMIGL